MKKNDSLFLSGVNLQIPPTNNRSIFTIDKSTAQKKCTSTKMTDRSPEVRDKENKDVNLEMPDFKLPTLGWKPLKNKEINWSLMNNKMLPPKSDVLEKLGNHQRNGETFSDSELFFTEPRDSPKKELDETFSEYFFTMQHESPKKVEMSVEHGNDGGHETFNDLSTENLKRKNEVVSHSMSKKMRHIPEVEACLFNDTLSYTQFESTGLSSPVSRMGDGKQDKFDNLFETASQLAIKMEFEDDMVFGISTGGKTGGRLKISATNSCLSQNVEVKKQQDNCFQPSIFTQFCNSTQVLKAIDTAILEDNVIKKDIQSEAEVTGSPKMLINAKIGLAENPENFTTNRSNKYSTTFGEQKTRPSAQKPLSQINDLDEMVARFLRDLPTTGKTFTSTPNKTRGQAVEILDDTVNTSLTQLFNSSQYRQDVESTFVRLEHTIIGFGVNQDDSVSKCANLSLGVIEGLLERTFKSPEVIKRVLQSAEESIRASGTNSPWSDDSLMTNAVINMSVEGQSIGSLIRKALMENAGKYVLSSQKMINATITEEDVKFTSFGNFYGLPDTVKDLIRLYKGIEKLYEWQDECLNLPAIKTRKNLVYALPTSGGKTLVAEILILREILCRKKNVIFVLPYVAIVQEKVWALSPFAVPLDFLIEEYAAGKGNCPPRKRRRKRSVYIATIEKALGLMNSLIETGRTDEIGLIVIDELHLIGDKARGPALEDMLTKIIHLKEKIQIVGMSATIGNLPEICKFLEAEVYTKDFRPVELIEYVKCGQHICRVDWNATSEDDIFMFERKVDYQYAESVNKIDPDQLGGLVMEVIPNDSCLIFCKSKKNCENVAILLCKVIFEDLKKHRTMEKEAMKVALEDEVGTLCSILKTSIMYGVAYHHSGLTSEERRIIEEGFRQGVISVICCTSTLAAGVNLPAKRVILRNPYIGLEFINLSRYKQMVGRAGRAGLGELGESILVATAQEMPKVRDLFKSPMDTALSGMHENEYRGLRRFILSCVSLGIARTKAKLRAICGSTLMALQAQRLGIDVKEATRTVFKMLFQAGALEIEGEQADETSSLSDSTFQLSIPSSNKVLRPVMSVKLKNNTKMKISQLGKAAIKGGLDLDKAIVLYDDLTQAQSCLVLFTGLHLMYLVTPYDMIEQIKPSTNLYYHLYSRLGNKELQTAKVLGLNDAVAGRMLANMKITTVSERVLNRFFITLMLYDLWNELPVHEVSVKYEVNRGQVQNLMTAAAMFACNVHHFCEELDEFWAFSLLLKGMSDRLSHCCIQHLSPLMELPAVKQSRAKQLYQAGFKTLQSVAKANPNDLIESVEFISRKVANQLIAAAKLILLERVENLREEAEDVMNGIEF